MRKVTHQLKRPARQVISRHCLDVSAFRGKWVALDPKSYKVIGHGASLEEARHKTPNLERLEPLLYFVPTSDAFFVGSVR
jgi:hypothetical protein